MGKFKYVEEFEINASKNILYPYISTPSGLENWFADKVTINEDKVYTLVWDGEDHYGVKAGGTQGKSMKFEFLDDNKQKLDDPNTLEFSLEKNEFTSMMYLKVTDYSENDDAEDLFDLWSQMVDGLKEVVGG